MVNKKTGPAAHSAKNRWAVAQLLAVWDRQIVAILRSVIRNFKPDPLRAASLYISIGFGADPRRNSFDDNIEY
jgi:hypothetical protein